METILPDIPFQNTTVGEEIPCYEIEAFSKHEVNRNHFNERGDTKVTHLVMHYTVCEFLSTMKLFTEDKPDGRVSAHYVITEAEQNVPGGVLFRVVPEDKCAWHAGTSFWRGSRNLNNMSIGIENVNKGFHDKDDDGRSRTWYPFDSAQIDTLGRLSRDIVQRHQIQPFNIVGHADIAPYRKEDPGILFPWDTLYHNYGVGAWLDQDERTPSAIAQKYNPREPLPSSTSEAFFLTSLKEYGYEVEDTRSVQSNNNVVLAFKAHFSHNQKPGEYNATLDDQAMFWAWALQQAGFLPDNIFPVCSIVPLSRTNSNKKFGELIDAIRHKLETYPSLATGFDDCIFAIKHCVQVELPVKRLMEAQDLAEKHILYHVNEAIQQGRRIIPDHISEMERLEQVVEATNAEQWGHIFASTRFNPTLNEAFAWKNNLMISERQKLAQKMIAHFQACFDRECEKADLRVEDLGVLMMSEGSNGFQVSHRKVEDQLRERLAEEFVQVVLRVSAQVAEFLYSYVDTLTTLLNKICLEEPYVFDPTMRVEHCQFEVVALLKRVAVPIIRATIRWSHDNSTPRQDAVLELARVVPWVAFQVCEEIGAQTVPNLSSVIWEVLDLGADIATLAGGGPATTLPPVIGKLLKRLF